MDKKVDNLQKEISDKTDALDKKLDAILKHLIPPVKEEKKGKVQPEGKNEKSPPKKGSDGSKNSDKDKKSPPKKDDKKEEA